MGVLELNARNDTRYRDVLLIVHRHRVVGPGRRRHGRQPNQQTERQHAKPSSHDGSLKTYKWQFARPQIIARLLRRSTGGWDVSAEPMMKMSQL
jgi:hypothetical protein